MKGIPGRYIILALMLLCFSAVWGYVHLPLDLERFDMQEGRSLKITDRYGIVLREVLSSEGGRAHWLGYEEIPERVIQALLAVEDWRFFSHSGLDFLAVVRALFQNLWSGEVLSGASTLTQQLVKNRFGYPRTLWGKFREVLIAWRLESTLSKKEILTQYLNRVAFSNQVFGIEAASRLYFGKPAQHLSTAEAVFLIGVIQAPSRFNPYRHFERAQQRQQHLLERIYGQGRLSDAEYQLARREEIRLIPKSVNFRAAHFCDMLLSRVDRHDTAPQQAAKLTTTLDYYLQKQVEDIVEKRLEELKDYHVTNAAVLVLDNLRGEVLAWLGSKDYFDESISGQVNGVLALRQPGSTLKPFTYQLALERAYTASSLLADLKELPHAARSFMPENYDRRYHGPVRLREALACSYNIPAFRLLEKIGVDTLYHRLKVLGFDSLQEEPSFYGPGLTLGNGEVSLLELTRAFSVLARGGEALNERYVRRLSETPFSLLRSSVSEGSTQTKREQILSFRTSYLLAHMLADRQAASAAFGENTPLNLPFVTAVKTGTSKDYRDNWTVGFTREYTVGVWVGNFDGSSMRKVSGISGAAPIYRDVMLALYQDYTPPDFLADLPKGIVQARICPLSGKLVHEDCPHGIDELFLEETVPSEACDMHRAYWVDSRDGLLTREDAPFAVKTVFIHFPPLYQSWAREMRYPLPPTEPSPLSAAVDNAEKELPRVRIVHPNDGDVYAIDPILRREFQSVQLSAVASAGTSALQWYIDGELWEQVVAPFHSDWPLVPGTHRIYAEGEIDGRRIRSPHIAVHVVE
ncbi:penicillin-binding protein 1C [candidate division KSB3 bacterium]|uniref:peptidoglycan glycosyltransferase n=1 Tax=candidate division KSB3 bacterium TaxID=2044937 RepID=A0A2G6E4Q3_9BACT|nr:MAG: penicillin-binding protein 1C [candidate division KSB3 bacterium]PIE29644.1 MAG: penicillin-binding protein 1C [candidate division KSB3 bacterium]